MTENEPGRFKGAVFGGFDRRSVMDYVEILTGERNDYRTRLEEKEEACDALQQELEEASARERELAEGQAASIAEREKSEAVAEARRARIETLDSDLRNMSEKLEETKKSLEDRENQLKDREKQLEEAEARAAELSGAEEAKCAAEQELALVKKHITYMEEENRVRAERERAAAAERYKKLFDSCSSIVLELKRDYSELREDAVSTAEHIRRQLTRLDERLGEMDGLFEEPAGRMEELENMIERGREDGRKILGE